MLETGRIFPRDKAQVRRYGAMNEATPEPQHEPAMVLDRWNSWVRLYFPSSGGNAPVAIGNIGILWPHCEQILNKF